MLKLYDKDHNAIGHLVKYKDCKKESDITTGDATLSFTYLAKHHSLENEMYIRTREDEYVIKEVSESSDGFPQIVAALNLEELEAKPWQEFSVVNATIEEAARVALAGTGWTIGTCDVTKQRNAGMVQLTSLGVIQNLCTAFMCEPVFDTIGKQVSFYEKRGEDKGVYLMAGLNLKKLQKKSSSYDFYTRIIPIGADGLTIEPVNGGKDYLENHQYSDKVRTYIWKDESYTDAQALKEDAQLKLNDMSKPEKSYSAQVRDLARQKEGYSILSYGLGDTIKLIDPGTGTMEEQRIVRMTQYEDDPEKNTCEIANTFLTFEEMQQKLRDAAAITNYTISKDGKIKVSDILKFEQGIADSTIVSGMAGDITTMQGELAAVKTTIGQIETNYLKADEASIKYAEVESLNAVNATVHALQGDYADFKTVTAQEIAAQNAKIDNLTAGTVTTDYLAANYANIKLANVETADVGDLLVRTGVLTDMTVVNGYVTGQLNGVRINADVITAGTLSVDRLLVTGEDSIVYQINVASSGLSMTELADEKYQKYLNGTDIVAASITGDRVAAHTLTADHILANSITGDCIKANTINGGHIVANSITGDQIAAQTITGDHVIAHSLTSEQIDVNDLFAQNITATGTISGANLIGATGSFTGDVQANSFSLSGAEMVMEQHEFNFLTYGGGAIKIDAECLTLNSEHGLYVNNIAGIKRLSVEELYCQKSVIEAIDTISCRGGATIGGSMTVSMNFTVSGDSNLGKIYGGTMELSAAAPYIDFHFGNSTADYTSRIIENSSGNININGVDFRDSTIFSGNWFRSTGKTGWYNNDYGGGWHMTDPTWVRSYLDKGVYTGGTIYAGNSFYVNTNTGLWCATTSHWVIRPYLNGTENCIGCGNASQPLRLFTTSNRVWLHNTTTYFATTSGSDRRLKKDFSEITEAYEKMYMDVGVSAFRYILDDDDLHYGFMAQDVEAALRRYGLSLDSNLYGISEAVNDEAAVIHDTNVYHVNYLEWVPLNKHMITKTIRRLDTVEAEATAKINLLACRAVSTESRLAEVTEELARLQAENQTIRTELEQLKQQRVSAA